MLTRATAKAPEQDDLFCEEVTLMFPALLALEGRLLGSAVRQQAVPSALTPCRLKPFTVRRVSGFEANLKSGVTLKIISAKTAASLDADLVLLVPGAITAQSIREALERGEGRWLHPKPIDPAALSAQD
ncbi:MAG: helicase, partial [Hyphomicrobium sp.]|nr:helicase [Hyphomicrobium sp.]